MKIELESVKGFSTQSLFRTLDRQKIGFLDQAAITHFMFMQANMDPKLAPTVKRMTALMRRISTSTDGKITYIEFAKLIKPVDLVPYLKRIRKRTK